ncbi:tetratricopeptide repeat protein [Hydrogenophaga sp. UC242_50]|uniref:tetratricopeptide repeat protein n=1 Tax=Hydrogenophaga sp. UC242_50 TaxID=3350169 RepID=UPI0036D4173C
MPSAPNQLHDAHALVIEGNLQSRSILVAQLRDLGVGTVVQCSRLTDGRRKLEMASFDVVICEQRFERESGSGQDLLDDLRRNQLLPFHTVFVMLTAEASYASVAEAAESALDAYLLKPHTASRLAHRIVQARVRKQSLQDIFSAIDAQDFERAANLCQTRFEARQSYWLYAARIGAELMLRGGRVDEAQTLYQAVIEAKTLPWARLGVARAQLENGQPAKAVTTLESLIRDDDAYADAYDVMGRAQFELGNFQSALTTYEIATRLTPSSISRLLKHGMLAYYTGERSEGVELLDRATRLGLDSKMYDAQALLLLAFARLDNNDARGLQRTVDQLTRLRDRSHAPARPHRLLRHGREPARAAAAEHHARRRRRAPPDRQRAHARLRFRIRLQPARPDGPARDALPAHAGRRRRGGPARAAFRHQPRHDRAAGLRGRQRCGACRAHPRRPRPGAAHLAGRHGPEPQGRPAGHGATAARSR